MKPRRAALQFAVIFCLLVKAFLLSGSAQAGYHLQTTQATDIDSILDPRLVVRILPQHPIETDSHNVVGIDTQQGKLYLYFDHKRRQLQVYADRVPTATIDYPAELTEGPSIGQKNYSQQKNVIAFCSRNAIFVLDLVRTHFNQIDTANCNPGKYDYAESVSWSPDGRFFAYKTADGKQRFYDPTAQKVLNVDQIVGQIESWLLLWSPRWDYSIDVRFVLTSQDVEKCPHEPKLTPMGGSRYIIVATARNTRVETILFCVSWEEIYLVRWLDVDRLLLVANQYADGATKVREHFVAIMSTSKVVSLGYDLKFQHSDLENGKKLARIRVLNAKSSGELSSLEIDEVSLIEPTRCALNLVDLRTLLTTDIEITSCLQPADIFISESSNEIFYIRSDVPEKPATDWQHNSLRPYARVVDLKTLKATTMAAQNARRILSLSPDNRYLDLLASDRVPPRSIYYGFKWPQSRLLVYDIQQGKVVYKHELAGKIFFDGVDWSPNGSAFVFSYSGSGNYLSLVTLSGRPQTTSLTSSFSGNTEWSPDGQFFLFYRPDGIRVVSAKDRKILTISKALETDDFVLDARWYGGKSHMLLIEAIPRQRSEPYFTAGRWVVDPARATE